MQYLGGAWNSVMLGHEELRTYYECLSFGINFMDELLVDKCIYDPFFGLTGLMCNVLKDASTSGKIKVSLDSGFPLREELAPVLDVQGYEVQGWIAGNCGAKSGKVAIAEYVLGNEMRSQGILLKGWSSENLDQLVNAMNDGKDNNYIISMQAVFPWMLDAAKSREGVLSEKELSFVIAVNSYGIEGGMHKRYVVASYGDETTRKELQKIGDDNHTVYAETPVFFGKDL